jgi:N-acetylglucosamine kinase
MSYVLGIDGGGSKTVCVLMDDTGRVLGRGESGASNYQSVGIHTAYSSIESAINQAIESTRSVKVEAICLGLAGVARPADMQVAQDFVKQLQASQKLTLNWALQPSNVVICNDALIALVGGLGYNVGIVAIAGTGSIIFGRNHRGNIKRVGGWGSTLGDEGSAYSIAVQGMRAALKAYDGMGLKTRLQEDLKQHLGLQSIEDLIEVIYQRGWGVKEIAALAPLVDRAAVEGDEVANIIIEETVKELGKATSVVIASLFNKDEEFEVVTTGSVWQSKSKIHEKFAAFIARINPLAKAIFPRHEPAYGAGLFAINTLWRSL